jgi:signal transduction histidine kinase
MAGRIAGDVGHDFNNCLAIVAGSLDLLEHRIAGGSEVEPSKLLALIVRARDAVQRAADLAAGLHGLSRVKPTPAQPTDLAVLLSALTPLLGSVAGRRVRLHIDLAPDLPPAEVDPGQLKAALIALCLNAREAMAEGGDLSLDLAAETTRAGSFVRLRVIDSGVGMVPEVAAHAPEPFFTTRGSEAAGLGLTEVIAFVRQAGGEVHIETTAGTGTTVSVLLPCAVLTASGGPDGVGPAGDVR